MLWFCVSLGYCDAFAVCSALPEVSHAQSFARSCAIEEFTAKCFATILSDALLGRFLRTY